MAQGRRPRRHMGREKAGFRWAPSRIKKRKPASIRCHHQALSPVTLLFLPTTLKSNVTILITYVRKLRLKEVKRLVKVMQ